MTEVTHVMTLEVTYIGEVEEVKDLTPEEITEVTRVLMHNLNADHVQIIKSQMFESK